jgi:CBS domain-containing protein
MAATGSSGSTPAGVAFTYVADVMRPGVLGCDPATPLREVARMMAGHRIHCVVVWGLTRREAGERLVWGVLSDLDLARAVGEPLDVRTAAELAATEVVTVGPADTLESAAQLMAEHETAHLVVASEDGRKPVGVISTLDLARAMSAETQQRTLM